MKKKLCLINLGCKVNQYELDGINNKLKDQFDITNTLDTADIYIVNTCAVTSEAERKSRQYIAKIKKLNQDAKIIVMGCASQNNADKFLEYDNVTLVIGNKNKGKVYEMLDEKGNAVCPLTSDYEDDFLSTQVRTRAYVKIQDGCNNFCSYCLIPFLRGRSRSRTLDSIVKEATLLSKTCKEIVLTGINVSDYRIDGRLALKEVLLALKDLPCRIRMSSFEVNVIDADFLVAISQMPNFCPHFHLSLQSGSDKVLKDMNRHYTCSEFLEKVNLIRQYFDNPAITTDLIVGYPTETEEDFNDTLKFLENVGFADVHFFAYSRREGTKASNYPQINGTIIKERENRLKTLVNSLSRKYLESNIDMRLNVLVEEYKDGYYTGFSENYIRCFIEGNLKSGEIVKVTAKSIYNGGLKCELWRSR